MVLSHRFAFAAPALALSLALASPLALALAPRLAPPPALAPSLALDHSGAAAGELDSGFVARILAHAGSLAAAGPRSAASGGEAAAHDYVAGQLRAMGLNVEEERLDFEAFAIEEVDLRLAGRSVTPVVLGLDPYNGPLDFDAQALLLAGGADPPPDLGGRCIVTNHPMVQFMVMDRGAALVACVPPEDFDVFAQGATHDLRLRVRGAIRSHESYNLVTVVEPLLDDRPDGFESARKEILVTAHLDAYQASPGANDNGTGLGAFLEIARWCLRHRAQLTVPVRFVAFGAEEVGAIGSHAYLARHEGKLGECLFVLNLDTLGGQEGPRVAVTASIEDTLASSSDGALAAAPSSVVDRTPPELRGRAWEALDGSWRILHPEVLQLITARTYPQWLQQFVASAATTLKMEVSHGDLISDHQSFAQAGVPAISIQSRKHSIHSPGDTMEKLDAGTLRKCSALAVEILRAIAFDERRDAPEGPHTATTR